MTPPLLWITLPFMAGIIIGSLLHLPVFAWIGLALVSASGAVLLQRFTPEVFSICLQGKGIMLRRRAVVLGAAALASASLGAARYQLEMPVVNRSEISWYNDAAQEMLVTGTVAEPPDIRDRYINLRLHSREIDDGTGPARVHGLLLVRVGSNQDFHYGQNVRVRGQVLTPPASEDFNYRDYLARHGIRSYMPTAEATLLPGQGGNLFLRSVYWVKERALDTVYRLFLDPEASLLAGILLGVDTGMPAQLEQAFNDTGTAHIIAISGFNIAVIAGFFAFAFNRLLGRTLGALLTAAVIAIYTVFVGAEASVLRAALMGIIALFAAYIGRRQFGINTLAVAAAVLVMISPLQLWDVGYQLSVLATLGLILYGNQFMDAGRRSMERFVPSTGVRRLASPLAQFIFLTFAAQLTTLPIIAYHFQQISLVSPLANAMVLPAQPAVMVLGGLAVIVGSLIRPLGQLLAWAAWPLTAYTIHVVELFADLPLGVIYLGRLSLAAVLTFYAVMFSVTFAADRLRVWYQALRARLRPFLLLIVALVLFACGLFTWRMAASAPDGRLHVIFLDVGSADAILIETPSGRRLLINGGPSATTLSDALGRRLSPIDHGLDWIIVAAADEEQVASLPRVLRRFPPKNVLMGAPEQASFASATLVEGLDLERITVTPAEVGQSLDLGEGATLKVVDVSSRGTSLLLEWNTFRMFLPIGANLDTLAALDDGDEIGPVSVLLLAQSGYAPLATPSWIANLQPALTVISVAPADRDGRPGAATLEALKGYAVLQTDVNGWIEVTTDGSRMWVESERALPRQTQGQ